MRGDGLAVSSVAQAQRQQAAIVLLGLLAAAVVMGSIVGELVVGDHVAAVVLFASLAIPVLFWGVRASPVIFLVVAATSIERFANPSSAAITARIPLFRSFSEAYGLSGLVLLPIEMILALAILIWLARAVADRRLTLRASHLGMAIAILLVAALLAAVNGLGRGGVFNISLWELRPFLYLALAYVIASQLVSSRAALSAILWGVVIGTGAKGVLGTQKVITMSNVFPQPESILEHDESVFFSCFILLTVALWVFGRRGYLRRLATVLLPFVLVADLGNNRRAAWLMLPVMLIALTVIAYLRFPERRNAIASVAGISLVLVAGYVFTFKSSTSLYAEPARAIWSQFEPDPRDLSSNTYRQVENLNLSIDIRNSPVVGEGFGVPIAHPIQLFDVSLYDPLIDFIPHNTILYVWLRMGGVGIVAFWFMVGAAVVAACRLARQEEPLLGLFGVLTLCGLIAWLVQGWLDKGVVSFRIAILLGCLLGATEAVRRLRAAETAPQGEPKIAPNVLAAVKR